jgi:hypothetical protein
VALVHDCKFEFLGGNVIRAECQFECPQGATRKQISKSEIER